MAEKKDPKKTLDDLLIDPDFVAAGKPEAQSGQGGGKKPPPGGPPKPAATPSSPDKPQSQPATPKPEPASGGPKASPEKAASTRTPEQAVADKATLRKVIGELDSSIAGGGLPDAATAELKRGRAARQANLDELLEQFPDSGASGSPQAKPVEPVKPAEAAKPAEVKLTPEQQALTDQVTAAPWLKQEEKNNFNAAIKGAKDPAELQRIEYSMNVLRDL